MLLEPMRYKGFVWPHNPRTYTISFERPTAVHKIPYGRYCVQDLGLGCRILKGEGEFVGEDAYETFKQLASLFYDEGPGLLVHPVWQSAWVYFTELSLTQEPMKDYVRYRFAFQEAFPGVRTSLRELTGDQTVEEQRAVSRHTVAQGETLWSIAVRYGVTAEDLLLVNPSIKNPNRLTIGQEVIIPQ